MCHRSVTLESLKSETDKMTVLLHDKEVELNSLLQQVYNTSSMNTVCSCFRSRWCVYTVTPKFIRCHIFQIHWKVTLVVGWCRHRCVNLLVNLGGEPRSDTLTLVTDQKSCIWHVELSGSCAGPKWV